MMTMNTSAPQRALVPGARCALWILISIFAGACGGVTGIDSDGGADCVETCADNATCIANAGTTECVCDDGYTGDGLSCDDVDECSEQTDDCDDNATCTNSEGGFDCACNNGFSGDGRTCTSTGVWRYDFEQLTSGASVAGQDGWIAGFVSGSPGVIGVGATPQNMTKVVTVDASSAGSLARKNDATFSFGPFTGNETSAYIQIDFRWNRADDANGTRFAIGNDLDNNGELSFSESVAIRIQDGRYGIDNDNIGPSASRSGLAAGTIADWYRLRLVMDFVNGTGSLSYNNLTRGDSTFSPIVTAELDLPTLADGAEVTSWNTVALVVNRLTEWDNLEIGLGQ